MENTKTDFERGFELARELSWSNVMQWTNSLYGRGRIGRSLRDKASALAKKIRSLPIPPDPELIGKQDSTTSF